MAKTLLDGFGLGGFRSFPSSRLQTVGPMTDIQLLAGPNNVGKSNVLHVARYGLTALRDNKDFDLSEVDKPLDESSDAWTPRVAIAVRSDMVERHEPDLAGVNLDYLRQVLEHDAIRQTDDELLWFEFDCNPADKSWRTSGDQKARITEGVSAQILRDLSTQLASQSGGAAGEDAERTLHGLARILRIREDLPGVVTIGAFRQIGPNEAGEEALNDPHNGAGLIDRLAELQNPGWTPGAPTNRFASINEFIGALFNDPEARVEIPNDQSMILVNHLGRRLPLENYGTGLHEAVIIAAAATVLEDQLVCIEEPEVHMHPVMQRRLIRYLAEATSNQYLIATHSAHMLDTAVASLTSVALDDGGASELMPAIEPVDVARISLDFPVAVQGVFSRPALL